MPVWVDLINSSQQERDDLTKQAKGDSHRPLRRFKRRWVITTLELEEEDPGPFPKFVGEVFNNMSNDGSLRYLIHGPGVDQGPEIGLFSIESENGKIYVHRPIDREKTPSFMIYFSVENRLTGRILDNSLIFKIRVQDVNDHAPQFSAEEFRVSMRQDHRTGQPIFQMLTVDMDQENTPNSQVVFFLVSQTPPLKENGFEVDRESGEIRLSGCLDYEVPPQFTLVIRAMDHGDPPLSSTATVHVSVQEGTSHRPTFTQEEYKVQVPRGQVRPDVLRLWVQDGDLPFTPAWRAKFNISSGDEEGHFGIVTDPETNAGVINVVKALDYDTRPAWSLVVVVENEEPLLSCEGKELRRPWPAASATVSVQVTHANAPPAFHPGSFMVSKVDGSGPGTQLGTFNAVDPDGAGHQVRYKLVQDPAKWVTVDERSGAVVTRKQIDRESPYVNNSLYVIVVHAVDDGLPPQTGTGTLTLLLSDVNDNAPRLHPRSQYLEVCEHQATRPLSIEAEDLDLEPYADPFTFELDGAWEGADGTWKLGESQGRRVELSMPKSLPRGDYLVPLLIGDRQGLSQRQTVHVRVCDCAGRATCAAEALGAASVSLVGLLVPLCVAFLILAVALLFLLRCGFVSGAKRPGQSDPLWDEGQQTLITYNKESRAIPTHDVECGSATPLGTQVYAASEAPRQPLEARAGVMAELLQQRLSRLDPVAEDPESLPHVYTEEGASERAGSLSDLSIPVQTPPPGPPGWLPRRPADQPSTASRASS